MMACSGEFLWQPLALARPSGQSSPSGWLQGDTAWAVQPAMVQGWQWLMTPAFFNVLQLCVRNSMILSFLLQRSTSILGLRAGRPTSDAGSISDRLLESLTSTGLQEIRWDFSRSLDDLKLLMEVGLMN